MSLEAKETCLSLGCLFSKPPDKQKCTLKSLPFTAPRIKVHTSYPQKGRGHCCSPQSWFITHPAWLFGNVSDEPSLRPRLELPEHQDFRATFTMPAVPSKSLCYCLLFQRSCYFNSYFRRNFALFP